MGKNKNKRTKKGYTAPKPRGDKRSSSWEDRESRDEKRDYKHREEAERQDGDKLSSLNDFSWYNRYPVLTEGAARLQFPYRPGSRLPFLAAGLTAEQNYYIPGVMVLDWIPSCGYSADDTSPVTQISKEIWAQVRSSFSSKLDVDPPDFIPYIMALDSLYAYIGYLKRIYNLLDWYGPNNHVMPDGVLKSMGLSTTLITNLRQNKADFNLQINYVIHKVKKFSMPFDIDIIKRHYWLGANVYTDAATINSQFYVFNMVGYYVYATLPVGPNGAGADKATGAELYWINTSGMTTYQNLITPATNMLNALVNSEDALIMNGYLMRAYGDQMGFTLDELAIAGPEFTAKYEQEVLAQIENSSTVLQLSSRNYNAVIQGANIWQDPTTNITYSMPYVNSGATEGYEILPSESAYSPLSIRSDAPSVEDVVIATRFKSTIRTKTASDVAVATGGYPIVCATEIPLQWRIWNFVSTDEGTNWSGKPYPTRCILEYRDNSVVETLLTSVCDAGAFDWRPICMYIRSTQSTDPEYSVHLSGDVHNTTRVSDEELEQLHRVCAYSEFNAFSYGAKG